MPGAAENEGAFTRFLRATEIDARLLGMIGAVLLIWIGFHLYGVIVNDFGAMLTARNLWNLSVQTASIGVMATGMVLVIVTRHIDLSVGSILGFTAMIMAIVQVWILPEMLGLGNPLIWIIAVAVGLGVGAVVGGFHGYLIAYLGIPAFIVTLGGLLVWRGAAFLLARGETISPVDQTFALLGGGPYGSIGAAGSWFVGIAACLGILGLLYAGRASRAKFNFPQRPVWAEAFLAAAGCAAVLGFVILVNSYYWPKGIVRRYLAQPGNEAIANTPVNEVFISYGFAIPVLILVAVGIAMTFLTNRTRFGR
ncbi:MAG: sugar ABC transporter permease, partial [Pseudomonadota bacterium]